MADVQALWFVRFPEKVSGPFTFEQLQKLADSGRLSSQCMVTRDELVWHTADKVANLQFSQVDTVEQIPKQHLLIRCKCGKEYAVQSSYSGTMRPCPKCGEKNKVPINSMADEGAPMGPVARPGLLSAWTVFLIGVYLAAVAVLATLLIRNWYFQFTTPYTMYYVWALIFAAAQVFFLFELRAGRSFAWVGIQILWAAGACLVFVLVDGVAGGMVGAGAVLLWHVPWWLHLYSQPVVNFSFARQLK